MITDPAEPNSSPGQPFSGKIRVFAPSVEVSFQRRGFSPAHRFEQNLAACATPVQGLTLQILFTERSGTGGGHGVGRASQDVVLPWAQARERDDRRRAFAPRD